MKKLSLEAFVSQNPSPTGRTSKLLPFKDDILYLKKKGYSQQQILSYLKSNDLIIGMTALNKFIKKYYVPIEPKKDISEMKEPKKAANNISNNVPEQAENPPVRRGLRRPAPTKPFNWEDRPDPESLK